MDPGSTTINYDLTLYYVTISIAFTSVAYVMRSPSWEAPHVIADYYWTINIPKFSQDFFFKARIKAPAGTASDFDIHDMDVCQLMGLS